jgi:integrase
MCQTEGLHGLVYDLHMVYSPGLRHTSATLLIANHVDVRTVSGRLGHANTRTTLDVYSHFLKEADEKAATVMADLLEARSA